MKFAAIDIGSNAIRLLIENVYETPKGPVFHKDSLIRVPVRLGEDAFIDGVISEEKNTDAGKGNDFYETYHGNSQSNCF